MSFLLFFKIFLLIHDNIIYRNDFPSSYSFSRPLSLTCTKLRGYSLVVYFFFTFLFSFFFSFLSFFLSFFLNGNVNLMLLDLS